METDNLNQTYTDLCDSNVGRSTTKLCSCIDHCSKRSRSTIGRKFKLRRMTRLPVGDGGIYILDGMARDDSMIVIYRAGNIRNSQAVGYFPNSVTCLMHAYA
jgi:hypothetical protein